jgi:hypothetical protein
MGFGGGTSSGSNTQKTEDLETEDFLYDTCILTDPKIAEDYISQL